MSWQLSSRGMPNIETWLFCYFSGKSNIFLIKFALSSWTVCEMVPWNKCDIYPRQIVMTAVTAVCNIIYANNLYTLCNLPHTNCPLQLLTSAHSTGLADDICSAVRKIYIQFKLLPKASFGFRVLSSPASVCLSVCPCVCINHMLVCTITPQPFKLESPNLDQRCKTPWSRRL